MFEQQVLPKLAEGNPDLFPLLLRGPGFSFRAKAHQLTPQIQARVPPGKSGKKGMIAVFTSGIRLLML